MLKNLESPGPNESAPAPEGPHAAKESPQTRPEEQPRPWCRKLMGR